MRLKTQLAVGSVCALVASAPVDASTFRYLSFSERVSRADLIVRGTAVEVEGFRRGSGARGPSGQKTSVAPQRAADGTPGNAAAAAPAAPVGLPVEGGSMIFTRVKLAIDEEVYGVAGSQVVLEVAGGSYGGQTLTIQGMPRFEKGKAYLLLLRRGYETAGDPVVGVNQGFFQVLTDPATGAEVLLDASGDVVIGVANDDVVVRHGAARSGRPAPQVLGAPVPDARSGAVQAGTSPDAARYWTSTEPPMPIQAFTAALRAAKEVRR